jgi:predicted RNase H-like nuclease
VQVFPEASAVLRHGSLRPTDVPKVQFRRNVLANNRIDTSELRSADAVDAGVAALTGLLALEAQFSTFGDPDEGAIVVPVRDLPSGRLVRPAPSSATAERT